MKAALEKEQSAHKDTNEELLTARKLLKETRKNLDEVQTGFYFAKLGRYIKDRTKS